MIYETVKRLSPLIPPRNILIVTSRLQLGVLSQKVPSIPRSNLLAEPFGRNTAPCALLSALHIQQRNPEALMILLPADHFIGNMKGFLRTLKIAAWFAARSDYLVTIGVRPTHAETGYGYIQKGKIIAQIENTPIFQARSFREKPNRSTAEGYLKKGNFFWNSGMFIWRVEAFLQSFQKHLPHIFDEMAKIGPRLGTSMEKKALEKAYSKIQPISIDYGIMEKAEKVAVLEAKFPWSDVGSWSALAQIWPADERGNAFWPYSQSNRGKVLVKDSSGCLLHSQDKLIAVIGLKDIIVVESGGAILVCPKDRSQDVRQILEEIKRKGWKGYT